MVYEHVQYGYFGVGTVALLFGIGVYSLPESFDESTLIGWAVTATLVGVGALVVWFGRLVVRVDGAMLTASFDLGRPRKVVDLSDVVAVRPVRNTWIQGWGIRKISGGWMYNAWGLEALEFVMDSGELARIGTNDKDDLRASVSVFTG